MTNRRDIEEFAQEEKFDRTTTLAQKLAAMRLHKRDMTKTEAVTRIAAWAEPEGKRERRKFIEYIQRRVDQLWDGADSAKHTN